VPPDAAVVYKVSFSATVSSPRSEFVEADYKSNVAKLAGVTANDVSIAISERRALHEARRLSDGTFTVLTEITARTSMLADAVSTAITTAPDISASLGVTVESITSPTKVSLVVFSPPPMPPTPSIPPNLDDETTTAAQVTDGEDSTSTVAIIMGIVAALLLLSLVALVVFMNIKPGTPVKEVVASSASAVTEMTVDVESTSEEKI
jgi:hypothetical protein